MRESHQEGDLLGRQGQVVGQGLHAVKVKPLEDGVELARHRLHHLRPTGVCFSAHSLSSWCHQKIAEEAEETWTPDLQQSTCGVHLPGATRHRKGQ